MMNGSPTDYWGKLEAESGKALAWHPLEHHCADVAACCEALLSRTIIRRRLARLAGQDDLSDVQVARLSYLAALHDIGKFNVGFQNKALASPPFVRGHVRELIALVGSGGRGVSGRLFSALPLAEFGRWGESSEAVARLFIASICHHGKPYRLYSDPESLHWGSWRGIDPFDRIRALAERAFTWFPDAAQEEGVPLSARPEFQHAYAGLVTLADWLGSNASFFPFSESLSQDRIELARHLAERAIIATGLDVAAPRRALPSGRVFQFISSFEPYATQAALIDAPIADGGGLDVLEAETGSGKTEAALARFLRLFREGCVDGMYFALPTRTAATQIHNRVSEAVARAFPQPESRPPVVLAVPGYIRVDDQQATPLPNFEVLWNEDVSERYRYRGWAAENPKRFLAGSIVIGTIDQALLSTIVVSHAHLRSTCLLRQYLVVDEVHASDAYMNRLLEAVLSHHLQAGGYGLLMSATLGTAARTRLLATTGSPRPSLDLNHAKQLPYPSVTSIGMDDASPYFIGVEAPGNPKTFEVEIVALAEMPEEVAEIALLAAAAGARTLVIRNTVADCVETQVALEGLAEARGVENLLWRCEGVPTPHHSRYAREDRTALDTGIERAFGKARPAGGCVAVATQTVQQSLDLDADFMISDLCPMDVLLQRAGRLHRHRRDLRPAGFERAHLTVLVPGMGDLGEFIRPDGSALGRHGLGSVYGDLRVLEASLLALRRTPRITIPDMSRDLVEESTHPEALDAITDARGGLWRAHASHVLGTIAAEVTAGSSNLVDRNQQFGDFEFPSSELARRVATRLGASDRTAHLGGVNGPLGQPVWKINIPAHLAATAPSDAETTIGQAGDGWFEFVFGLLRYRYDRHGLHAL